MTLSDDMNTRLAQLSTFEEQYVHARAMHMDWSVSAVLKKAGLSRNRYYDIDEAVRDDLEELARDINRDTVFKTLQELSNSSHDAARKLIEIMNSKKSSPFVQLQAATKILEYTLGTPQQRVDVTSQGETLNVKIEYEYDERLT